MMGGRPSTALPATHHHPPPPTPYLGRCAAAKIHGRLRRPKKFWGSGRPLDHIFDQLITWEGDGTAEPRVMLDQLFTGLWAEEAYGAG